MVRISKQAERRGQYPRKLKKPQEKTGALKDNLPKGFKEHSNGVTGELAVLAFIPKVR